MNRRSLFSLAALLLPGAFDRIAAATIATAAETEAEPVRREAIFRMNGDLYRFSWSDGEGPAAAQVRRDRLLAGRPQPEPEEIRDRIQNRGALRIVTVYWPDDPGRSCARCRWSCNATIGAEGRWMCHVGPAKDDYLGGIEGVPAAKRV
jgi:hypothetical protein